MLSIIAAVANNNVIGKDNKLIWKLPADLKRFKMLTSGKVIIMGRKTFESLGRVLPNRKHVVLTRDKSYKVDNENVEIINDLSKIDKYINDSNENFVIGGAQIYKLLLQYSKKMYITKINNDFEGDTYFPEINEKEWNIESREKCIKDEKNKLDYEFINYIRK